MTDRRVIVDHVDINVVDLDQARAFYSAVLTPLGIAELPNRHGGLSYGVGELDDFGIFADDRELHLAHVAFEAPSQEAVDQFYEAAVHAGGTSVSGPQIRPQFSERYYSAYVRDPEGHGVEAVYFVPLPEHATPANTAKGSGNH